MILPKVAESNEETYYLVYKPSQEMKLSTLPNTGIHTGLNGILLAGVVGMLVVAVTRGKNKKYKVLSVMLVTSLGISILQSPVIAMDSLKLSVYNTDFSVLKSGKLPNPIEIPGYNYVGFIKNEYTNFIQIPLYGMASAGNGLIESEESNIEYINIPKLNGNVKKSDFATRVKGDSMEPYYHNGDIIVVDVSNQDIRTLNGKEALIYYDDNKYLKLVYFEPGTGNLFLRSYNVAYSDIKVENREVETLSCKGTVSMVISMRNRKMI